MDDWRFDITNEGVERLGLAMTIAFSTRSKATHYCDHPKHGLVLLWYEDKSVDGHPVQKLPFPLSSPEMATQFAWSWLQSATYGEKPDTDGSCGKGWRVHSGWWKESYWSPSAIIVVQPEWSVYGK